MERSNAPLERSGMPVQVLNNSQMPENVVYSSQYRPMISPNSQQIGVYVQKQSFVPVQGVIGSNNFDNRLDSTIMHGSMNHSLVPPQIYQGPVHQSNVHSINNISVAQSNYIPNYQMRNG